MSQTKSIVGLAAALAACLAAALPAAEQTAPEISPAEAAVRKVVEQHIQGIVNADVKLLESSWDTKAGQISFVSRNKDGQEVVQTGPITESFKLWTAQKLPSTKGQIQSVDVVNDRMALVKAKIIWQRQTFDDYLVLLNTDGQWKLVSKTYTNPQKSASPYGVTLSE